MKDILVIATLLFVSTGVFAQVSAKSNLLESPSKPPQAGTPQTGTSSRLEETLHRMDLAGAHFKAATADFHKEQYTSPLPDPDLQNGSSFVIREGGHTRMGARIEGGEAQIIAYDNGNVRIYKPGLNCFNDYSGKGNQAKIESFLTLGFGGSGRDLASNWHIQDQGEETLPSDGRPVKVEKLLLAPKEQSVRDLVKSITLWVDLDRDIALKQVLISPNDDRQTASYSNIRMTLPSNPARYVIPGKPCSSGGKR